ncbi:cbb3-type cytochrome c oxidase subunit 3 [Nevskia sp.]|uniref:cbb3-type cytochrome oxidase subunit 3 n=1 Tax=Nevskia sp. TaxID=1929292 RepID=UPI0025E7273F|nr:cbb3-type cytochrome c oxidase subunit 3 [Nevskia sp.]
MISGIFTIAAMTAFAGISWWAYSRRNTARFEEASRLPLVEDEVSASSSSSDDVPPPCCCRSAP